MTKSEVHQEDIVRWTCTIVRKIMDEVPEITSIEEDALYNNTKAVLDKHFSYPHFRKDH